MADRIRPVALAAIALSFFFMAMSGLARAATLTVTNTNDIGAGSLRGEILAASSGDTIDFSVSGTIILGSDLPAIAIDLTIDGAGQTITVDGANLFQIFRVNSGTTVTLRNLTIAHGNAGLLFNGAGIDNSGTLTVADTVFSGNHAPKVGGAIDSHAMLTVTGSTFSGNSASFGGGIFNDTGTLTVTDSTFSDNIASGTEGGGIANHQGTLGIAGTTFVGNQAPGGTGGAVFSEGISQVAIINSTFSGNSASDGGAIFDSINSNITVTNSTFSGNQADISGGAVFNNFGGVSLKASILAASTGGNCSGTIADAGYNISDDNTCGFSGTSINNSTTLNLDPAGLQNNGGPTQTIAIEPNSQALNFIPVASCKDQSSPTPLPLIADQRNFPRPDSGNLGFCDAGAFELQTERITVVPGSEQTQIARPTSSNSDQINTTFTFTDNGTPPLDDPGAPSVRVCDSGNDALNGISVDLFEGTCADLATATGGLLLDLTPFVKHTIDGQSYGTIFQSDPPDMLQQTNESVSARIVRQLLTPLNSCGKWTIHIEVMGLNTATLGLGGGNPFALVVEDGDKNEGCFDIDNAVVGGQLTPPHKARRGARRGRR